MHPSWGVYNGQTPKVYNAMKNHFRPWRGWGEPPPHSRPFVPGEFTVRLVHRCTGVSVAIDVKRLSNPNPQRWVEALRCEVCCGQCLPLRWGGAEKMEQRSCTAARQF